MNDPEPLGPLRDHTAERTRILKQHADAVLEVYDRHRKATKELMDPEVALMLAGGLSPKAAEQAAKNNLALKLFEVDMELEQMLDFHGENLRLALERLEEGLHNL